MPFPAWSPDGSKIAYIGRMGDGQPWEIRVMPAGGGSGPAILSTTHRLCHGLDWQRVPPVSLDVITAVSPTSLLNDGDEFRVSIYATNTGGTGVAQVKPSLTYEGEGEIALIDGPHPAERALLGPDEEVDFLYWFEAKGPGQVTFSGQVQGVDAVYGGTVTSATFTFDVTINPGETQFEATAFQAAYPPGTVRAGPIRAGGRLEPVWTGDTIQYEGKNWDPDGGPIEVLIGDTIIATHPASDNFSGEHRMPLFPEFIVDKDTPPACQTTLKARQGDVEKTIELRGQAAEVIVFAENAEVSAVRGEDSRPAKNDSIACAGEIVALGPPHEFSLFVSRPLPPLGHQLAVNFSVRIWERPGWWLEARQGSKSIRIEGGCGARSSWGCPGSGSSP